MTGKTTRIQSVASLATIDRGTHIRKHRLEDEQNLAPLPLLGQRELRLVQALLVGNTLGHRLAIEPHTILVGAKALQFPARRHTNLRPLTGVTTVRTLEIPLHHVVAAMSA